MQFSNIYKYFVLLNIIIIIWITKPFLIENHRANFKYFLCFSFVICNELLLDLFCRLLEIRWKLFTMHSSSFVCVCVCVECFMCFMRSVCLYLCCERIWFIDKTPIESYLIENIVKIDTSKFEISKNVKEIEPIKQNIDLSYR